MNQLTDIRFYLYFIALCRRWEWLATRGFRLLQRLFFKRHTIYSREEYFRETMKFIGVSSKQSLSTYMSELLADTSLKRCYENAETAGKISRKYAHYEDRIRQNEGNVVHYYALIRELQPKVILETGTAIGSMTSWILAAFARNGMGELISIDIPPVHGRYTMDLSVEESDIGFLIPEEYRTPWRYIAGDAKIHLPKILAETSVDVFIHDSLHTRTHMLFEYNVARALLREGALILSDDILWNKSFFSFVESHDLRSLSCISNPNLGLTINHFDTYERNIGLGIVGRDKVGVS